MARPRRSSGSLLALLVVSSLATALSQQLAWQRQQQSSPLIGSGQPSQETQENGIYVSFFLDRVLSIDDSFYSLDAMIQVLVSWVDSVANQRVKTTVGNSTVELWECSLYQYVPDDQQQVSVCEVFLRVCTKLQFQLTTDDEVIEALADDPDITTKCSKHLAGCTRPCTTNANAPARCCDGIFIPDFYSPNMHSAAQDSLNYYNIFFDDDNRRVSMWMRMHATYILPMTFTHYPFDNHELKLRFQYNSLDPSPNIFSSAAAIVNLNTEEAANKGDDTSDWRIVNISSSVVEAEYSYNMFKTIGNYSSPGDPSIQLTPGNLVTAPIALNNKKVVTVSISITRDISYHVCNSLLPILICGYLGMLPFFLHYTDVSNRIMLVVTVFLSLTAVQFVVSSMMPATSYLLATQWLVLGTYTVLGIVAIEAIVVYEYDLITAWLVERKAKSMELPMLAPEHLSPRSNSVKDLFEVEAPAPADDDNSKGQPSAVPLSAHFSPKVDAMMAELNQTHNSLPRWLPPVRRIDQISFIALCTGYTLGVVTVIVTV